jgi:TolB protein
MSADGRFIRRLTTPIWLSDGFSGDFMPAWSPDGRTIAFSSYRSDVSTEIWRIGVDGGNLTRLTRAPETVSDYNPTWSPDGRWIWFDSNRDQEINREIYKMRADGTGLRRMTVTGHGIDDLAPDVSPDGRRVVFTSNRGGGTQELYTMTSNGTGTRPLGPRTAFRDEADPRWSADGKRVLFWSYGDPDAAYSIAVINADGHNRRRLDTGGFYDSYPDPYPTIRR